MWFLLHNLTELTVKAFEIYALALFATNSTRTNRFC